MGSSIEDSIDEMGYNKLADCIAAGVAHEVKQNGGDYIKAYHGVYKESSNLAAMILELAYKRKWDSELEVFTVADDFRFKQE